MSVVRSNGKYTHKLEKAMPLYDCGERECEECQKAFGPNRQKAIRNFEAREVAFEKLLSAPPAARGVTIANSAAAPAK
jgi:hypothetical protein